VVREASVVGCVPIRAKRNKHEVRVGGRFVPVSEGGRGGRPGCTKGVGVERVRELSKEQSRPPQVSSYACNTTTAKFALDV